MNYIPSLERVIYEFRFTRHSGPEYLGLDRWIQVKMRPRDSATWRTAIVSDTVDCFSDEVRYLPCLDQEAQAEQLAVEFVNKHYKEEL